LTTPGWIAAHVAVVVLVVGFLGLGWWQVRRAADGNMLSFGYAVEWPVFAAFVIFVWVREMRRALRESQTTPAERSAAARSPAARSPAASVTSRAVRRPRTGPAYDDSGDAELAAYNRYLAWRNANPGASRSDYPGDPVPSPKETT
jgi:DNA-binding transcriptional regulator of glucitol operon